MNKNSTHEKRGNFISKISAFFTILPALPVRQQRTGGYMLVQHANLAHYGVAFISLNLSSYIAGIYSSKLQLNYFLNPRQPQKLQPVFITQF